MNKNDLLAAFVDADPATRRKVLALLLLGAFYHRFGRALLLLALALTLAGALLGNPVLFLALLLVLVGVGRGPITSVVLFFVG